MAFVNSRNYTEQNLKKKAIRSKLLELCKTTTKKSILDMFIFYVNLAGQDMVADIAGLPRAGGNSKSHHYKQKKSKKTFRKHGFQSENSLKISDIKKNRNNVLDYSKNPMEQRDVKAIN